MIPLLFLHLPNLQADVLPVISETKNISAPAKLKKNLWNQIFLFLPENAAGQAYSDHLEFLLLQKLLFQVLSEPAPAETGVILISVQVKTKTFSYQKPGIKIRILFIKIIHQEVSSDCIVSEESSFTI